MKLIQYKVVDKVDGLIVADAFSTKTDAEVYIMKEFDTRINFKIEKYYIDVL